MDTRSRSKSSDDVRRTVATGTEDLHMDGPGMGKSQMVNGSQHAIAHDAMYKTSNVTAISHQPVAGSYSEPGIRRTSRSSGPVMMRETVSTSSAARPTSVPAWSCQSGEQVASVPGTIAIGDHPDDHRFSRVDRSRVSRSEIGRRRSLERMQCIDYTDQSPTSEPLPASTSTETQNKNSAAASSNHLHHHHHQHQFQQQQQQQQPYHPSYTHPHLTRQASSSSSSAQIHTATGDRTGLVRTSAAQLTTATAAVVTPTPSSSGDEAGQVQQQRQLAAATVPASHISLSDGGGSSARMRSRSALPTYGGSGDSSGQSNNRSASPTIKVLQEYEAHLRNALAKGSEADTYSLNTFETILSQSMENVVALMKEVQSEIEAIRREESHYRSGSAADEAVFTHRSGRAGQWSRSYTLPSRGTSLPPPGLLGASTGDLYSAIRKSSAPVLDTLSVDGAGMHFLRPQSSFESTASDSKAYLTSSEVSVILLLFFFLLVLLMEIISTQLTTHKSLIHKSLVHTSDYSHCYSLLTTHYSYN